MADDNVMPAGRPDENGSKNAPVYQSKLRAKREERIQQQQQQQQHQHRTESTPAHADAEHNGLTRDVAAVSSASTPVDGAPASAVSARSTTRSIGPDDARRRERAEARQLLIGFTGSAWDVVRVNDLVMLRNFFLVEGAAKLAQAHSKDVEEFGRTLLHTAAWWGCVEAAQFLLSNGATINEIDTVATRLTPLMDAARAGHTEVALLLLDHRADATLRDTSGDNAFHWAARHNHGTFLLQVSLALDALDHSALVEAWTAKNVRGRTPADYIRSHPTVFPMISKRLSPRVPLHRPTSSTGTSSQRHRRSVDLASSTQSLHLGTEATSGDSARPMTAPVEVLSGVNALGLDVGRFAYKSRDSVASH